MLDLLSARKFLGRARKRGGEADDERIAAAEAEPLDAKAAFEKDLADAAFLKDLTDAAPRSAFGPDAPMPDTGDEGTPRR